MRPCGQEGPAGGHRASGRGGTLLAPTPDDLAAIDEARGLCAQGSSGLFAATTAAKLKRAAAACEKLARRFDVVVANPPYMGSSSFGPFMSKWVKKNYPDVKSDLCTCFIERGFSFAKDRGYAAMVTMQSWMFLGSFEKMRSSLIDGKTIVSMAHLGPRAFDAIGGEVVNVTADVIYNGRAACEGAYVRLVDINGSEAKRLKLLEAIQNPDCGWFYRRDADTFKQIPGTPIAYWASDAMLKAFNDGSSISAGFDAVVKGSFTGDNNRFLRLWYEVSQGYIGNDWRLYNKGGAFRRWFGNREYVIFWRNGAEDLQAFPGSGLSPSKYFDRSTLTWSKITSGKPSFRFNEPGVFFDDASPAFVIPREMKTSDINSTLAFLNSTVTNEMLSFIAPTLNCQVGDIISLPRLDVIESDVIERLASSSVDLSKIDYDSLETSWDFKRHPLLQE